MPANRLSQSHSGDSTSNQPTSERLNLDGLFEPGEQGPSVNELSQAYAALLAKEADPEAKSAAQEATRQSPVDSTLGDNALSVVRTSDEAACAVTPRSILEAILFVGHPTGEPLMSERIAALMRGVRPSEIDEWVRELNAEYDTAGAPYSILANGGSYQVALRPEFGPLRDTFHGRIREARLSQAAIDVLAIVGYHQPIAADEIDRLRGRPSGAILSQLIRRDLLVMHRPAEKKAKPVYRTTDRFLGLFGLEDLKELPRRQDLEREL
jgi:segregation and condensation protein B